MKGWASSLSRCVKCGRCRSVCPVFQVVQREPAVARGKLALLEACVGGGGDPGRDLVRFLSLCLLCGRCTAHCPNQAKAHEIIQRARVEEVEAYGLPLAKRIFHSVLNRPRSSRDPVLRGASTLQSLIAKILPQDRGLRLRLPLRRWLGPWAPSLVEPFFLDRIPREIPSGGGSRGRVGLFVGCGIHYLAPQVGEASVELLRTLSFHIFIPSQQGCCGLMAYGMGEEKGARDLALQVMEAFEDEKLDAVVVPCASCAVHLKVHLPFLWDEGSPERARAEAFSARVWELSRFLVEHDLEPLLDGSAAPEREEGGCITYHDPCHLWVGLGIREEPRRLLRALVGEGFREMEGADRCCGMGGAFRLTHPGISRRILRLKVDGLQKTGAGTVATTCMGCWIQLQEGIYAAGLGVRVRHLAELLRGGIQRESPPFVSPSDGPRKIR